MTDLAIAATDLAHADVNEPLPRQQAVVNCVLYQEGRRVKDLAVEECSALTGLDGAVVWLGLHEPDADLLETVRQQFALHELIIEDANQMFYLSFCEPLS
jgi:magnesium transporter